jgi:hypothetical protein
MASETREWLGDLADRMRPHVARERTLATLDEMFRAGSVPDPLPHGFCPGTLVTTSIWGQADQALRKVADLWMPWKGKAFDSETQTGVNIMDHSVRVPMRVVWPRYEPIRDLGDRYEVFRFRNRVGAGAIDGDVKVYKIDYDFDENPSFVIRSILDELVEIEDGLYLGKILYRVAGRFRPIGYFTLERGSVPRHNRAA